MIVDISKKTDILKQTIKNYIEMDTDYAIQIDGDWGKGKSHFVKNELIYYLRQQDETFLILYVSINGVNSIKQFQEIIQSEILSSQKIGTGIKIGEKIYNEMGIGIALRAFGRDFVDDMAKVVIDKAKVEAENKTKNNASKIIIFIDDLERIGKEFSYIELFGFVNANYLENKMMKIIFISDENKIDDKNKYLKIKEKTISRTIEFNADLESSLFSIAVNGKHVNSFYSANKDWALRMIKHVCGKKSVNLRTINYFFTSFDFLLLKLNEEKIEMQPELKTELEKRMFLNLLVIAEIYKNNKIKDSNDLIILYEKDRFFDGVKKSNTADENLADLVIETYHHSSMYIDFDDLIYYSKAITEYVLTGYIDIQKYVDEIKSLYERIEGDAKLEAVRIGITEENPMDILYNFRDYNDTSLSQAQETILSKVHNGDHELRALLKLYELFLNFDSMDLILIEGKDYREELKGAIQRSSADITGYTNDYFSGLNLSYDGQREELRLLIEKKRNEFLSSKVLEIINDMFTCDNKDISKILSGLGIFHVNARNIFEVIIQNDLVDKYILVPDSKSYKLTQFISGGYLNIDNAQSYSSEDIPSLEELKSKITSGFTEGEFGNIDTFKIEELIKTIDIALQYLDTQPY